MNRSVGLIAAALLAIGPLATAAPSGASTPGSAAVVPSASTPDARHCTAAKWDSHPDRIHTGKFRFGNGTRLRTAGYNDCTVVGLAYPSHRIDVHCSRKNDNGVWWVYVRDVTTGKAGWASYASVYTTGTRLPPRC